MVPNGAAYDNYPSFANNGTKTPPGGSTESAKYALGMVPADTFPAEWANYLFHGATAGITRLNSDTGSIKKEINTVLSCKGITPDATVCDQLYCALLKIRDDAVALAYPVGTVYMNAKSATLPAEIQAIGTWCAIDGRFLRACSACISCTGGASSVTLAVCNLPSHSHSMTHCHGYTPSGSVECHRHQVCDHCHGGSVANHCHSINHGHTATTCVALDGGSGSEYGLAALNKGRRWCYYACTTVNGYTGNSGACQPTFTGDKVCGTLPYTSCIQPSFTGTCKNTDATYCKDATHCKEALPNTGSVGSGTSFSILPPYRDVAMWYRDA